MIFYSQICTSIEIEGSLRMEKLEEFKKLISEPGKIVITTHIKPDADALGSSLGLSAFLQKLGHKVTVITPSDYPSFLNWMCGNEDVLVFTEEKNKKIEAIVNEAEIIFCLDFSSLDRIEDMGKLVRKSSAKKVLIDHHLEPEHFADFMLWSIEAAATAQLIYDLIDSLGQTKLIDSDIANALYAGIMTDTGSFRHPGTTSKVFRTCAHLIECGADVNLVAREIYDKNSINRLRLMGHAVSECLTYLPEIHTAYIVLTREELNNFDLKTGDTEGLVNMALSVEGVKIAALFNDKGDSIKMSFRSVGDISVNEIARKHFNGGGHKNAAGGKSNESMEEVTKKFESVIRSYLGKNE